MPAPKLCFLILQVAISGYTASCDVKPTYINCALYPVLVADIHQAAAGGEAASTIRVPDGEDVWIIASAYSIQPNWDGGGLRLSQSLVDELAEANMLEQVMIARVRGTTLVEIVHMSHLFACDRGITVVRGGEALCLARRQGDIPLVISVCSP